MIRLTGFGPFRDVVDNPSSRLVLALAGRSIAGHRVEARVLPVRWRDGLDGALRGDTPALLIGFGVATRRTRVAVEALGTPHREGTDVDGALPSPSRVQAGDHVPATLDVSQLAAGLDADVSQDAGTYLCNAWAHDVVAQAPCPAAFVHIPPAGLAPERLASALATLLGAAPRPR